MERKLWDNVNRNRYYGLRKGDVVDAKQLNGESAGQAVVDEYGFMDNNAVMLKFESDGSIKKWVAEWCEIITKIEDIEAKKN